MLAKNNIFSGFTLLFVSLWFMGALTGCTSESRHPNSLFDENIRFDSAKLSFSLTEGTEILNYAMTAIEDGKESPYGTMELITEKTDDTIHLKDSICLDQNMTKGNRYDFVRTTTIVFLPLPLRELPLWCPFGSCLL